jgi:hypothetical protein
MKRFLLAILPLVFLFPAILRAGDKPQLWLYYSTNLAVDENIAQLTKIWQRAGAAGYTHVLLNDSKFARLGDLGAMSNHYFANIRRIRQIAADNHLQIVPALFPVGYSNDLLWHDPNLAEGLPVKDTLFVVKDGQAQIQADPPVSLDRLSWKDDSVKIDGKTVVIENNPGNARFVFKLKLPQFRCYHVSVKIKTRDFNNEPCIKPLVAGDRLLSHGRIRIEPTQDWKEYHVIFNTLDNTDINLYFGIWGDAKGRIEFKDWNIEEVGLLNVLRRPGAPCVVKGYVEGKDYQPIRDPQMGSVPYNGEYQAWHEPPTIKTSLPNGTLLRVSWYYPPLMNDEQVNCCISEPKTMALLADQAKRLKVLFNAPGYMMSHDEIRVFNWCDACQKRNLDAGAMLADNVRQCTEILKGATVYAWNDMFDPYHNAVDGYYLVHGNLKNSWDGLDKNTVIVNWNHGNRDKSLKFFADQGNPQLIAGYYEDVNQIKDWLKSAKSVKGIVGYMYTTWENKYEDLEEFAKLVKRE